MIIRPPLARLMLILGATLPYPWATAFAHDFWIRPSSFTPATDAEIAFALEIGHVGESERYGRNPSRIERFVIAGPGAAGPEREVPGTPGADPAGISVVLGEGVYVVGYRSNHARNELTAAKFESYLREEGLEDIVDARADAGESEKPGVEVYSRCAKSLIRAVGTEASRPDVEGAQRALGFTLELIPLGDPTTAKVGDRVSFRLLHEGEPYAGAKVEFAVEHDHDHDADDHEHEHEYARTDSGGVVSFVVDHEGLWVVNSVVMEPASEDSKADWESWWASVTFHVAGAE